MKVVIFHTSYGCDTGCCGHTLHLVPDSVVKMGGEEGFDSWDYEELSFSSRFEFDHPWRSGEELEWAKEMVEQTFGKEHVKDLDWDHCIVSHD